ncbi:putative disease resistance RPP13-like protein 1 [Neltuma alba]|uniref:putative disease resistance RPP13-like protein 1 n=1 Tax=Neltuma alba TaxID=207710 RepID=UPI0010A57322|nr:putative disease resistance RPP13-like protein 1 [Prosopis alba]
MAEALLSAVFNVLLERLTPELADLINKIAGKKLDDKLLNHLRPSLIAARAVLNNAELRQFNKDQAVKDWLNLLKDAVYDLEDLMDEISTRAATQKKVSYFSLASLTLRDTRMARELEAISDKIERIVGNKDVLDLKQSTETYPETLSWRPPVTSHVEVSQVYGRNKAKEDIIKLMFDGEGGPLSVIPIVGMGGVGKTTLVNLVYKDVKQKFDLTAWVCVSETFDLLKIVQTIIKSIDKDFVCDNMDLNLLGDHLAKKIEGKKFLIVLDDYWNEKFTDWDALKKLLHNGVEGCKILVTTRIEHVASMVKTISSSYPLEGLSEKDCLSIFAAHAFHSRDSTANSCLEKIGRDVVSKCKGLPLAAKVIGGLFRSKPRFEDWNDILKDTLWDSSDNEIIPPLRVSYYYLPPYLKQCFAYCSLFPEDYIFDRDELIMMWMAEGFLGRSKGNMTLEEVGYGYIDDLTSRSFFQPLPPVKHPYNEGYDISDRRFVMHDLIHELATHVAEDFYFRLRENRNEIGTMTRHLSCNFQNRPSLDHEVFQKLKGLRTFIGLNFSYIPGPSENASHILSSDLKYMRTLSLSQLRTLKIVPESIGEFVHLRYLDLSGTGIASLPDSICKLYNLQTLKLRECNSLLILPGDMQELKNLRHLDVRGTNLKEIPRGLGKLKDLQFLSGFIVGKEQETGITELGGISNLKGEIVVSKLENVKNEDEADGARMMEKKRIETLTLSWSDFGDAEDSSSERNILAKLQPHWDLKQLTVKRYRGTIFPDWLGNPSYHNMTFLRLEGCENCCMLPPLGQLPALKTLHIYGLKRVKSIGDEFLKADDCSSMKPFPSLEYLYFHSMASWEQWLSTDMEAFPKLQRLTISSCNKLVGSLPSELLSLETLVISYCSLLSSHILRCPKLRYLHIYKSENVAWQEPELPQALRALEISGCRVLESVLEALAKHSHLQELTIRDCSNISTLMIHLPQSLQELSVYSCKNVDFVMSSTAPLQSLRSIKIHSCSFVKFMSDEMEGVLPNLRRLWIFDVKGMEGFPEGAFVPSLREIYIHSCNMELIMSDQAVRHLLRNIADLRIASPRDESYVVKCFPEVCFLPTTLTTLGFFAFRNLETLNCSGLQHLTSLQKLNIQSCPKLEKMSGEKLPASLTELRIWDCPLLKEKYHNKDEQFLRQISHIPLIHIDWDKIIHKANLTSEAQMDFWEKLISGAFFWMLPASPSIVAAVSYRVSTVFHRLISSGSPSVVAVISCRVSAVFHRLISSGSFVGVGGLWLFVQILQIPLGCLSSSSVLLQAENPQYEKFRYQGLKFAHELNTIFKGVIASGEDMLAPSLTQPQTQEDDKENVYRVDTDLLEGSGDSEEDLGGGSLGVTDEMAGVNLTANTAPSGSGSHGKRKRGEVSSRQKKQKIPVSRQITDSVSEIATASKDRTVVLNKIKEVSISEVTAEVLCLEEITSNFDF